MRIHVVTPKAPVHVTLNPRVQPAPASSPIFVPGSSSPLRLSQSAYWVLRLPYPLIFIYKQALARARGAHINIIVLVFVCRLYFF